MNITRLRKIKARFAAIREMKRMNTCLSLFFVSATALLFAILLRQPVAGFASFVMVSISIILMNNAVWTNVAKNLTLRRIRSEETEFPSPGHK